jgi:hypothetical protein
MKQEYPFEASTAGAAEYPDKRSTLVVDSRPKVALVFAQMEKGVAGQ